MAARSGWGGGVVAALVVGYLGMITLGSYVVGGAVIDAMRAQQTADVAASLPHQEIVMLGVAQERSLATVVDRACTPRGSDCAVADQARAALLHGGPESSVQQTVAALERRDQALDALDVGMLDPRVRDAIGLTLGDRAIVDEVHGTLGESPGPAVEVYDRYLQDAAGLSDSLAEVSDGELRGRLDAQRQLTGLLIAALQERSVVALALRASPTEQPGYLEPAAAQVTAVDEQVAAAQDALDRSGSDQQVPPIDGDLAMVRSTILSGDLGVVTTAKAGGFATESAAWFHEVAPVLNALRTETVELAQGRADVATNRALLTGAITGAVLLVGLIALIVGSVLLLRRRRTPPPRASWQQPGVPTGPR